MKPKHWFTIGAGALLAGGAFAIYNSHLFENGDKFVLISAIVLFGLGLTVILFAILAIVYSFLNLDDPRMALGLPDGSVRALLAFSLVLIFVCLATYLYSQMQRNDCQNCSKTMALVTDAQLTDLKNNFNVAAELAHDKDGNLRYEQVAGPNGPQPDLRHPLYNVTYYPKPDASATDFAKQIFTTVATIFVSVVSFYFGSSVTTSAVRVAQGPGGDDKLQAALTNALADSHNAQVAAEQAAAKLKQAQDDLNQFPVDQIRIAAVQKAQDDLTRANADLTDKQRKVQEAQKALNDAKGRSTGAAPSTT